jgi:hypothetical protein
MAKVLLEMTAVFVGVIAALFVFAGATYFWARRRLRRVATRLIRRAGGGDLSVGGVVTTLRINRHGVSTGLARRRLQIDVQGAVSAVHEAERAGAPVGELGSLAAELELAAHALDQAMASMGTAGVTPVVLSRARELSSSARALRHRAEELLVSAAVPGHQALVASIGTANQSSTARRVARARRGLLPR